ncbi:MAG: Cdc6/Cdc18 family protein [Halodesulfurarchaeum sp.]
MHIQHTDDLVIDPAVFQEEWVPGDFRQRDAELDLLGSALEPMLSGEPASDVFVWGPSGAGKTSAARVLLDELGERVADLDTHAVSCWSHRTRHRVLYEVLAGFGSVDGLRRTAVAASEVLDRVERTVTGPAVLVLDEVDQLDEPDVLYDLYHVPGLVLFLVANSEDAVLSRLEPRLRSRLASATSVHFERYGVEALVDILSQRVRHGLAPGAVEREHLEHVADTAAGNARDAIRILGTAARLAEHRDREQVSIALLEEAVPAARSELRETRQDRLGEHQEALYEIITRAGSIAPGEAYERYTERVAEPRSKRRVRDYVRKLAAYDLIEVHGQNRGRRYTAVAPADGEEEENMAGST